MLAGEMDEGGDPADVGILEVGKLTGVPFAQEFFTAHVEAAASLAVELGDGVFADELTDLRLLLLGSCGHGFTLPLWQLSHRCRVEP
jgi:hypothetical protein